MPKYFLEDQNEAEEPEENDQPTNRYDLFHSLPEVGDTLTLPAVVR